MRLKGAAASALATFWVIHEELSLLDLELHENHTITYDGDEDEDEDELRRRAGQKKRTISLH